MNLLKKILSYPLSIIHYFFFGLTLLVFHPIQWLAFNLGGYNAHKKVIDYMNLCLVGTLFFLGSRIVFKNKHKLPKKYTLNIGVESSKHL